MTTVVLFHSAQGQTPGFHAFADELRSAGHTVHAPDLFDGVTFGTVDDGVAHARGSGSGRSSASVRWRPTSCPPTSCTRASRSA